MVTRGALIIGSGLLDVGAAGLAVAALDPVSTSFTLAPGASRTVAVTVTVTRRKRTADGHYQATLRVSAAGTEVAHAMLYTLIGTGDAAVGQHQLPPPFA